MRYALDTATALCVAGAFVFWLLLSPLAARDPGTYTTNGAFPPTVSLSGDIVEIAPPPSVQGGVLESDDIMFIFLESESRVLDRDLQVEITASGFFDNSFFPVFALSPGVIPAGTLVNSWFVHFDAVNDPQTRTATMSFDCPILGLIATHCQPCEVQFALGNSDDIVGSASVLYEANSTLEPDDWLDVTDLAAGGPITLQANVIGLHDQMRVITASGDACECGNADGNASVDFDDALHIARGTLQPPLVEMIHPRACDADGNGTCDIFDALRVAQATLSSPLAEIVQECEAATAAPIK